MIQKLIANNKISNFPKNSLRILFVSYYVVSQQPFYCYFQDSNSIKMRIFYQMVVGSRLVANLVLLIFFKSYST